MDTILLFAVEIPRRRAAAAENSCKTDAANVT